MSDGGKGSKPRPFSVTQDEYENRWNAIFQRDDVVSKSEAKRLATMEMANKEIEMPGTIGSAKIVFKDDKDETDKIS
jgi:hypothetical protein